MRMLPLFLLALGTSVTSVAEEGEPQRNADNHCLAGAETVVFHCATDKGKWISVCADAKGASPAWISYRYGAKGKIELQKPDTDAQNLGRWTYESTTLARGESRSLYFVNDGYKYEVFVTEAGMDTAAGVVVSKDKPLATLTCAGQEFTSSFETVVNAKKAAAAK